MIVTWTCVITSEDPVPGRGPSRRGCMVVSILVEYSSPQFMQSQTARTDNGHTQSDRHWCSIRNRNDFFCGGFRDAKDRMSLPEIFDSHC